MQPTIVAPQPLAAEEGLEVLRRGGNAVDAAVTAAFVQGVVDPQMCGIGGGGVMLVHAGDRDVALEFYPRAGSRVHPDQWADRFLRVAEDRYGYVIEGWANDVGYASVGVPGTVLGLHEALISFGTIAWDQAIRPAIAHARDGVAVSAAVHHYWARDPTPDVVPNRRRIQATPESRRIYTKDGELYAVGERLVHRDQARTLELLARRGPDVFYRGDIAARIAEDFAANGGSLTREDLATYRVDVASPVRGTYRGRVIVSAGPPAGGTSLIQMLNFLEGFDFSAEGWPAVEPARLIVEAMGWAFRDRERHLADPHFGVPAARLTAKEYAAEGRAEFARGERFAGTPPPDSPTTTQVSVIDAHGNAVSLTHTLGSGSGVVTPGLGFGFNNYLNCFDPRPGRPNSLAPGKTRVTMMTPTFVYEGDRLWLVLGAPGGTKIVGAVLQVLLNLIDHGMEPLAAVSAPRIDHQGGAVEVEGRLPLSLVRALEGMGYRVHRRPWNYDVYFGQPQLVVIDPDGRTRGASDPRRDGGVALRLD